jgi:hypothetical protein
MIMQYLVALIVGIVAVVACLRLVMWHRRATRTGQAAPRRLAALLVLQPLTCALLYCALFPPAVSDGARLLRVATGGTSSLAAGSLEPFFTLPEASAAGGIGVPDLGTALRRQPGVQTVEVLGQGLTPRDIDALPDVALRFRPGRPPVGIIALSPPGTVAPGARFLVGATVSEARGSMIELIDPAGRVTDRGEPDAAGHVLLAGTARAAGPAIFTLRLRKDGSLIDQASVPVLVEGVKAPRLLILAGAPGAEVKFLRRWATDAGYDVTTQISAGGGIVLGDAPVRLDAASLGRFDAAIVDDRVWPVARDALMTAVRSGMGLILHAGGPAETTSIAQWQALGFDLKGTTRLVSLALPAAPAEPIARTRHGIANEDVPTDIASPDDALPDVSRLDRVPGGTGTVPLLDDNGGTGLAAWRQAGMGRIALFTAIDSYGLILTGRRELHNDWWSALLNAVLRPAPHTGFDPHMSWQDERLTLCDLQGPASVIAPDGRKAMMLPVHGCGAYWPRVSGFHQVQTGGQMRIFYVHPRNELGAARQMRDRTATMLRASDGSPNAKAPTGERASPWIWWIGWMAASLLLWWLERSRLGRKAVPQSAM